VTAGRIIQPGGRRIADPCPKRTVLGRLNQAVWNEMENRRW